MSDKINTFEKDILTTIKENYGNQFSYRSDNPDSKYAYYLRNISDHCYEDLSEETVLAYSEGNGGELKGTNPKFCALRSSSAMTYNIFGNYKNYEFEQYSYNQRFFEFKNLPTLRNSGAPANIDVFLQGREKFIFFEMKMCEWLLNFAARDISISYLNNENFYNPEFGKIFDEVLHEFSKSELYDYDALQMLKHSLGIFNYLSKNQESTPVEIELINGIWQFEDTSYLSHKSELKYKEKIEQEEKGFENFLKCMKPIIELYSTKLKKNFVIRKIRTTELINKIKIKDNESELHKQMLKRYVF